MCEEQRQNTNRRARILDALRLIDGFDAGEIAQRRACTLDQAETALNELKNSGHVICEYEAMRGYVWRVIR